MDFCISKNLYFILDFKSTAVIKPRKISILYLQKWFLPKTNVIMNNFFHSANSCMHKGSTCVSVILNKMVCSVEYVHMTVTETKGPTLERASFSIFSHLDYRIDDLPDPCQSEIAVMHVT